ncbi:uncharacterized protein LOC117110595 [Anneissia japonica]|uniref:uncharacterized protein LOC117110595 n=1 Tax=Anneissia japonica TaxID=1529436 RepID=UPI0014256ED9|nr:uncharacterized protein LOC117110595 [Anneissia japonica]
MSSDLIDLLILIIFWIVLLYLLRALDKCLSYIEERNRERRARQNTVREVHVNCVFLQEIEENDSIPPSYDEAQFIIEVGDSSSIYSTMSHLTNYGDDPPEYDRVIENSFSCGELSWDAVTAV